MGSKIESKLIANRIDVACVPGYHGENQDPSFLLEQAKLIGVPLLIKASAGGGGKGMRRVDDLSLFLAQLSLARQEAKRAFGDDRVLLEKLIQRPRHLEVQLAGDKHGNLVHIFERECSIQRNYQKVIEEAPAPRLAQAVREKLFSAAIKLGREIAYDSLGTVEFVLAEGSDEPYFLEMNTRLQVEHQVTEMVCGLDLVEWQMRIASGEPLPLTQENITATGWAIEARINCEDPAQAYRPELGKVARYVEPALAGVRTDSGITAGSEIAPHYDSMIAKIIGFGATRAQAADRLREGLSEFEAAGIGTNQSLLCAIVDHRLFHEGRLTTGFLSEAFGDGWVDDPAILQGARIAAALYSLECKDRADSPQEYWHQQTGYRFMAAAGRKAVARWRVCLDEDEASLAIERDGDGWKARVDDCEVKVTARWLNPDQLVISPRNGAAQRFGFFREGDMTVVNHVGSRWNFRVLSEVQALARVNAFVGLQGDVIKSEMPGAITNINVAPGDEVAAGDVLVVMEAMKLIFPLAAPRAGRISTLNCAVGETVLRGQALVQLVPLESAS
jgi:3-methylcrotonyl-CoA carboxylase alpha subunit